MRVFRKWLIVAALSLAPLPAFGQSCGDFNDVSPSDFYCNNVEWLKNRGVTLGCTVTSYCPNAFVLRSQMAAFMQRLGDALTARIVRTTDAAFDGTYDPSDVGCVSIPIPVTDYPRRATFAATLMNLNAAATKVVQAGLVFSTDGGTTWASTGDFVMWQTVDPGKPTTLALVGGPFDMAVGSTYQFAIQTTTNEPAVTVQGECQLNTRIESRTGSATPF